MLNYYFEIINNNLKKTRDIIYSKEYTNEKKIKLLKTIFKSMED